jgi:CDP-paratose 2-epimerase
MSAADLGSTGPAGSRKALITGGAGFIGANLAHRLLKAGEPVILFDNLSRPSVARNVEWLRRVHGDRVTLITGDVRDAGAVASAVRRASCVFHFAAQVAVTTSLIRPVEDFEINAWGMLNVLETTSSTPSSSPGSTSGRSPPRPSTSVGVRRTP